MIRATVWLTYAWLDNENGDVDFVAQELRKGGLIIKLDRWDTMAGLDLWKQIKDFITEPKLCDAWLAYATQNSLGSASCMKEYLFARDRALASRGIDFPVIVLFPSHPENTLLSPEIRERLYVSTIDSDWKERIIAAAEHRSPKISKQEILPYYVAIHREQVDWPPYAIEFRPRAGTWSPFFVGIPIHEKDTVSPSISYGPKGRPVVNVGPISIVGLLALQMQAEWEEAEWWYISAANEASPTQSYFLLCNELPSVLIFGVRGVAEYKVEPKKIPETC